MPRAKRPLKPLRSVQRDLSSLACALQTLAGDLAAAAPTDHARRLARRVRRWRQEAQAALSEVESRRGSALSVQLKALGLTSASRGLKLHLGAADVSLPGWVNVDRWPAELAMDLRWGLPFADGAADAVYLCHVLEHFYYPGEALSVLEDIRRVLAPGSVARIVVPDIGRTLRAYVAKNRKFFAARRAHWPWWPKASSRLEQVLGYAGVGLGPDSALGGHRFGYDFETLRALLRCAGFARVTRSRYMQSRSLSLRIDDASLVAGAKFGRRYFSLFVDAQCGR